MVWGQIAGAVFGGIMGGVSKQQENDAYNKQVKIQDKYNKEVWKYENEQAEDKVDWLKEGIEIQKTNNLRDAKHRDATNLKNWQLSIEQTDFNFVNQLMAKAQSDQTLQQNLAFNESATENAIRQQDHWMHDKALENEFNLMDMGLEISQAEGAMELAYQDIFTNHARQRNNIYGQMDQVQQQRNEKRMDIAFRSQDNQIAKLIASGKAQNQQAGRSTDKSIQAAEMAGGLKEAELTQQATNIYKMAAINMEALNNELFYLGADTQNKAKAAGQKYMNTIEKTNIDRQKIAASYRSSRTQDWLNREDIKLSKQQADMNAWANNMLMPMRGPTPPPPYATPLPDLQQPMDHVWSPKPVKGAQKSGGFMSGLAPHLAGIGGAIDGAFNQPQPDPTGTPGN